MKKIVRIFFVFFIILIALYTALIIVVHLKSRQAIINRLQTELGRKVSIEAVRFLPLSGLNVENLAIEGLLDVREIRVFFNVASIWQKDLLIDSLWIYEPDVAILRTRDNKIVFGNESNVEAAPVFSPHQLFSKVLEGLVPVQHKRAGGKGPVKEAAGVVIKDIHVMDGRIKYADNLMEKDVTFAFGALNFTADFLSYPLKAKVSRVELDAFIEESSLPLAGSRVFSKGWIDALALDMDGNIRFIDKSGETILDVNLKAKNNDMAVKGQVSLNNFMFKKEKEGELKTASIEDVLLNALNMAGLDIVADFSFQTKMNDFQVEKVSFSGKVGYNNEDFLKQGNE